MRYIKKTKSPDYVSNKAHREASWKKFHNRKKLKKHILKYEQKYICAYCEIRVNLENSHIEHVKPKAFYPEDELNYNNLVVSCNGKELAESYFDSLDLSLHSCGHEKQGEYDEELFLSPVLVKDIENYFKFNKNTGAIVPNKNISYNEQKRAKYTIYILNLDNFRLNQSRLNSKLALEKEALYFAKTKGFKRVKKMIRKILNPNKNKMVPFISFLDYCFKDLV